MRRQSDEAKRTTATPRDRTSLLSAAVLRISASLDLNTVLHEIVESARALTSARLGAIITIDPSGRPEDFVSSGVAPELHQKLEDWPDGQGLFEHFRDLPGALRRSNLRTYVRSLGHSPERLPSTTFLVLPVSHRGEHVGTLFLGDKETARQFTSEDEETLMLFAPQAAAAVANASAHRTEQRSRAGLEALLDTSPVGVAVFDLGNGPSASLNREARRLVEGLYPPGRSPEQSPEAVRCRRADGREFSLGDFPRQVESGAPLRAEEIVLSVPDGRSVKTLVNAAPAQDEEGAVASVIVTFQDLTPLEELERSRAEFLGMVSHELRAPLTSIKGSAATVLGASPLPDPAEMLQFFRIINEQADHMRGLISDLLDAGRIDTGTLSVTPEPSELAALVDQARNTFLSGRSRHTVLIDLPPDLSRVMADRQRIVQVLNNLLSNAARHSPESSPIRVAAARDGVHVAVSVSDEGSGVAPELLPHLFQKHTGLGQGDDKRGNGGSGLGLAICKGLVEAHGGRIWAASGGEGQGTRFSFTVPVAEWAGDAADRVAESRSRPAREGREPVPILVVDDDPETLRYVREALPAAGYAPVVTGDHREMSRIIRAEKPQLVLLDLILPGVDGIELLESVPELADLPVIFISGYGRDETIARALESGAADYIVKPFSPTELAARIRAALRRRAEPEPFVLGDLAIHYEERRVTMAGTPMPLTVTEYELLRVLAANAGRVTTYDSLIRQVWGGQDSGDPELVRTFVKKLRRKLGDDAAQPTYIFTERGVGYRMARVGEA